MGKRNLVVAAEHFLHLREKALRLGAGLAGLVELLEEFLLLGRQVHGRLDHDLDVHVAALARAHDWHALAAQAELVPALGACRNVDARELGVEGRDLDAAAERGLHHRERHLAVHVGALTLEQIVAAHRQEHVEVARRAAARAGLAFAGEANARAVLDAGWNVDLESLVAPHAALARASLARLVDHLPRALAGVAGAFDGEEALLRAQPAVALAGRALVRLGTGLRAHALADFARDRT